MASQQGYLKELPGCFPFAFSLMESARTGRRMCMLQVERAKCSASITDKGATIFNKVKRGCSNLKVSLKKNSMKKRNN